VDYFDADYFDPAYFDTAEAAAEEARRRRGGFPIGAAQVVGAYIPPVTTPVMEPDYTLDLLLLMG